MKRILTGIVLMSARLAFAGFASNEVYLASVGRGAGSGGAQFYSTVWVTNLSSSATVHFTFFFLKDGQSNLSGAPSFQDTLAPGQTKLYENVTETKLVLPGQFGAARITADGEIFASERVYNLASSTANLGTSEGLFFAAVPKNFAIGLAETASIQGINQGSPTENMRSNFDLVETTGNSCTVHVTLLDSNGASKGATDVPMQPYGHVKQSAQALLHSIATINDRIVATVTSGSGKVILAGEQLANTSQDSSGFEMSFKDSLLGGNTGGNCSLCVTSLNGLTGAVTIAHGANTTVNVAGNTITIDSVGGGSGTGLTAVAHDNTLAGSGTAALPLGIAAGGVGSTQLGSNAVQSGNIAAAQVVKSLNGLHDAVTLVAGSNVTITPSGQTLTFDSPGLTLPYAGTFASGSGAPVFRIDNTGGGDGIFASSKTAGAGVTGEGLNGSFGVQGLGTSSVGVYGSSTSGEGVHGEVSNGSAAVAGNNSGGGDGVDGTSSASGASGVNGSATGTGATGVYGSATGPGGFGVYGTSTQWDGVHGEVNSAHVGVAGVNNDLVTGFGVYGKGFVAGYFQGNVTVTGAISAGTKDFKIDHPLDPGNKYLVHASVESNEMKNLYDGEVTLDASGTATVTMPDWFSAENDHVRYQLTAIGTPQPGLFISSKLQSDSFRIAGGVPGAEVSWQVTGVRRDVYARAHPLVVEEVKPEDEQGTFLHPELYGQPLTKSADPIQRDRALKAETETKEPNER